MPPASHAAMESSSSSGPLVFALVFASFFYLRGWRGLQTNPVDAIPSWRMGSFLLGVFCIWLALCSPVAAYDHELLTVHMIQHLLLMTFAPPLILLGAPLLSLYRGLPRSAQAKVTRLFRWTPTQASGDGLLQLAVCWTASAAALVGWHIPSVFAMGMQSNTWHAVEQASFLVAGFCFWWPVIQPWPSVPAWPRWAILVYLFLATLPCDILSGFLVFSERVAYPLSLAAPRRFGFTVLEDQQCAAALMWTCITVVYLVPAAILTMRLLGVQNSTAREPVQSEMPLAANGRNERQKVAAA